MAALTEIRHCFPHSGWNAASNNGETTRATTTNRGGEGWGRVSQNSGGQSNEREREKNARETAEEYPSVFLPFFLAPFVSIYLPSPSLCLRQRAPGERLPILLQGQDRDFNQLAGFLGPGK